MNKAIILATVALAAVATSSCKHKYNISDQDATAAQEQYQELSTAQSEGKAFIARQLKADTALKQTASGLVYKITVPGSGEQFKEDDKVKVIYTGKHVDGQVFDSSNGQAVSFPVAAVVPGFKQMLLMMRPGAKAYCIIPGDLAYGQQGTPDGSIAPNETLVFEIEAVGLDK